MKKITAFLYACLMLVTISTVLAQESAPLAMPEVDATAMVSVVLVCVAVIAAYVGWAWLQQKRHQRDASADKPHT
jgi:uncharacterized protein HemX